MMKIDAHHHFWQPRRGDYDWMPKDDPTLSRAYGPGDLAPHLADAGVDGTVLVQAAATLHETEYLLGLADATAHVKAVVGWVNFEDPAQLTQLRRLKEHPKFVGVRPMIQDIADVNWMLREDIQWAYRAIVDLDLTFDALGYPQHQENFLSLIQRHPDMRVVFDHCMKPRIRDAMAGQDAFTEWARGLERLAAGTDGMCKLSGLVTEAAPGWTIEDLRPFARHVLDCFGPDRVMWGSDWPVCRLQAEYDQWYAVARDLTDHLSAADQERVFGGTAARFYRLSD